MFIVYHSIRTGMYIPNKKLVKVLLPYPSLVLIWLACIVGRILNIWVEFHHPAGIHSYYSSWNLLPWPTAATDFWSLTPRYSSTQHEPDDPMIGWFNLPSLLNHTHPNQASCPPNKPWYARAIQNCKAKKADRLWNIRLTKQMVWSQGRILFFYQISTVLSKGNVSVKVN